LCRRIVQSRFAWIGPCAAHWPFRFLRCHAAPVTYIALYAQFKLPRLDQRHRQTGDITMGQGWLGCAVPRPPHRSMGHPKDGGQALEAPSTSWSTWPPSLGISTMVAVKARAFPHEQTHPRGVAVGSAAGPTGSGSQAQSRLLAILTLDPRT